MYNPMQIDEQDYYIKPMNCPFHILMYRNSLRRLPRPAHAHGRAGHGLPLRAQRTLQGLMRVRGFTQDDSHIFVTEEMLDEEITRVVKFIRHMLTSFGFSEFEIFVSTRPKESVGTGAWWDKATRR